MLHYSETPLMQGGRKDRHTDGHTDGHTEGQVQNIMPHPHRIIFMGTIKNILCGKNVHVSVRLSVTLFSYTLLDTPTPCLTQLQLV